MARYTCECGARYRFDDAAVGKRSKCQKCGAVFTLVPDDEGIIPFADDGGFADEAASAAAGAAGQPEGGDGYGVAPPVVPAMPPMRGDVSGTKPIEEPQRAEGYLSNLLLTLAFVRRPGNMVAFIFIWFLLCLAEIVMSWAPCVGFLGQLVVFGWYCAFRFGVIIEASAGEPDLPSISFSQGWIDDVFLPMLKWIGSWIVVLIPAIVSCFVLIGTGAAVAGASPGTITGGVSAMILFAFAGGLIVPGVLCLMGLLMWPLIVLCIALGGFASVGSLDLIIKTLFRTFPMYLLTVVIVVVTAFVEPVLQTLGFGMFAQAVPIGVGLYVEIIALRAIGLYYYHFKHRFAWSWE